MSKQSPAILALAALAVVSLLTVPAASQSTGCRTGPSAPYRQDPVGSPVQMPRQQAPQPIKQPASVLPAAPPVLPPGTPLLPPSGMTPAAPSPLLPGQNGQPPPTLINAPVPPAASSNMPPTGQFGVQNGKIIGPDGQPFLVKGINVSVGQVDPATILATLPGLNGIRLASTPGSDPGQIDAMVQGITSKGGVVLIEDHSSSGANGGNNVLTGAALKAETDWYAGLAFKYKNNPNVWFGTANEPDNPSNLASIAAQEGAIYEAIRGTGNTSMVALEMRGGFTNDFAAQNPGTYANMRNVFWDTHVYGWTSNYSTDPSAVFSAFGNQVANAQSVRSGDGVVPTVVGEYGPSTTGLAAADPNGTQTIQQVLQSKLGGFAWAWDAGTDNLTRNGKLTPFGQQVADAFAASK